MNKRLAQVNRSRMNTLNAIRQFGHTDANDHLRNGLKWLNAAMNALRVNPDAYICALLFNAQTHLQVAKMTLGFDPFAEESAR